MSDPGNMTISARVPDRERPAAEGWCGRPRPGSGVVRGRPALPGPRVRGDGADPTRRPRCVRVARPARRDETGPGQDRDRSVVRPGSVGAIGEIGGDDRVELGGQQFPIGADEIGPGRGGVSRRPARVEQRPGGRGFDCRPVGCCGLECEVPDHVVALPVADPTDPARTQALICRCALSASVMLILRGFAFSAIGIRRVSTPAW
ncbi:hypothetical protein GCM10010210_00560 [Pseudonocardia hydrocarbonoxydans]|uniref:Uncharacterized protein n=1 Tax=Pseudonocardia hydrocarbonoxydans TaxID=76726 RepID=A0A4Y3WJH0_9PSEU|nr:hypothetical protein PHY01_12760 [Pseudonocardia hydrocarbonoxydans]